MSQGVEKPAHFDSAAASLDSVIARAGRKLVVGIPLGIGKPNGWINALYERAIHDDSIELHILTALSLDTQAGEHPLEKNFWRHVNERVNPGYAHLRYLSDYRRQQLPRNVQVSEFFLEPGAFLHNDYAQRHYQSSNYTHVWRDMRDAGVNVLAQMVAPAADLRRFSLSSNSDVTVKLLQEIPRKDLLMVGEVNRHMPYMYGPADLSREEFDVIVNDPDAQPEILAVPAAPLSTADYWIGLHASALVKDGGTIEIGFGSIGDAVAYCLALRHEHNDVYRALLERAGILRRNAELINKIGGVEPFNEGLYGASEMLTYGLFKLFKKGIVSRRNSQGFALKGGFFLGPQKFYDELRELPESERLLISMAGIDDINQIYGADPGQKRHDRVAARFINNAMMVTGLGAIVSDGIHDGRVVSGVGGQYNFVAMAHAMDDARSLIVLRSTRRKRGKLTSNMIWNYAHTTVPRHLRDIVISEFGIADLRGQTDQDVVARTVAITHPAFRSQLIEAARGARKSEAVTIADDALAPADLSELLAEPRRNGFFPAFPFGSDFTDAEIAAGRVLRQMQQRSHSLAGRLGLAWSALVGSTNSPARDQVFDVLGLTSTNTIREKIYKKIVADLLDD